MSLLVITNPDAFLEEKRVLGWFISDEERFLDPCYPLGSANCTEYHLSSENGYEGILFVAIGTGFVEAEFMEFEVPAEYSDSEYYNNFGRYED